MLLIDKPYGWTSFDVVNKLRYRLKEKKVGHAGTLDPLATGLLIVCTGAACKNMDQYMGLEKEYTGVLVLGQTTASHDLETPPTQPVSIDHLSSEQIRETAHRFQGHLLQVPPQHSAIRVKGKRAYSHARKGREVTLEPRPVEVRVFDITSIEKPRVHFRIVCSKGTYIRSLVRDVGEALGVGAYLETLCRTRIGPYELHDAQKVEQVSEA